MRILVTGGAGFIGSAFVRLLVRERPAWSVVVFDTLTYAGNLGNLAEVDGAYAFIRGDIADAPAVQRALATERIDAVVNFAAESHNDRANLDGTAFVTTDVLGTYVLLTEARRAGVSRYVQVSTDEVYGSVEEGRWTEESPLQPNGPYSASKAGGDLQVRAAFRTYGFPAMTTRGSNTYGPYQYPEKVIPLFVTNILERKKAPLYGDGKNKRDWLYVDDHARGVLAALEQGVPGEAYNLGSDEECENQALAERILSELGVGKEWIEYVPDRLGHDRRYALDSSKAHRLGWRPTVALRDGLKGTVQWYREHADWWKPLKSGEFLAYHRRQYEQHERGDMRASATLADARGPGRGVREQKRSAARRQECMW